MYTSTGIGITIDVDIRFSKEYLQNLSMMRDKIFFLKHQLDEDLLLLQSLMDNLRVYEPFEWLGNKAPCNIRCR
jgi:hypothetical protein